MNNEVEIFKDIPNYEGYYQVSNLGRVKSLSRFRKFGNNLGRSKERLLALKKDKDGYNFVTLCKQNSKYKNYKVHQLVAIVFLDHIPNGVINVVDHINNIKTDNRLNNLQIISNRLNQSKDQWRHNRKSLYVGVSFYTKKNKWVAKISVNNKTKHLGCFDLEIDADKAYKEALDRINIGDLSFAKVREKTSKYKGVYWRKSIGKWESNVTINGKKKYIGTFLNEDDAYQSIIIAKHNI